MKKKLSLCLLLLIFLIGAVLRLYRLSESPPTLNWDEAAWGYNAYSLMQTAKDEYRVKLPVFTRSFDEYKSALPSYLMVPFIYFFGLTETAVRLPSAILGSVNIILIYFLVKMLFRKDSLALTASSLFAIEPWSVHLSRVYHDANIALLFLLVSFLFYLYGKTRPHLMVLSSMFIGFSWFTYNANKLFVPMFVAFLLASDYKCLTKIPPRFRRVSMGIIGAWCLLFAYFVFKGQMFARAGSTHIFSLWPGWPSNFKEWIFVNPFYQMLWELVGRYMAYFSPTNLFVREPLEPATILAGNSIFHPFEFSPWLVGMYYLVVKLKNKYLLALLCISPIPAALTWNWFQPGRTLTLFLVFSILIAIGMVEFVNVISPKSKFLKMGIYGLVYVFLLTRAIYVFDSTQVQLVHRDTPNWQPGFDLIVPMVMEKEQDFEKVVIDTPHAQPYIFYLFYGQYDPFRYHQELDLEAIGTPRQSFDFGKFVFRDLNWQEDKNLKNTLFIADPEAFADGGLEGFKSETIYDVNSYPIAKLVYKK